MGFLEDLTGAVEGPLQFASGVVNGVKDGVSFTENVIDGDWDGAFDDGRKLMGDAGDISMGLASLGFNVGGIPSAFQGAQSLSAESQVIQAALMAIAGMKLTTGTGTPYNGDEFRDSSERLDKAAHTLFGAAPHSDRWDGTASQVYAAVNDSHAGLVSDVSFADLNVANVIDSEAEQVTKARNVLDEVSRSLRDWDLATCWLNACGAPGRAAKLAADLATVALALPICTGVMANLVGDSIANSMQIRDYLQIYVHAALDTAGNPMGGCEAFSPPGSDDPPLPGRDPGAGPIIDSKERTGQPSRSLPGTPYTVPSPEELPKSPPATPYSGPTRARSATESVPLPATPPASGRSPTPAPQSAASTAVSPSSTPANSAAPGRASGSGERAPVTANTDPDDTPPATQSQR